MDLSRNTERCSQRGPTAVTAVHCGRQKEFWWLGAFLNFPLGLIVAVSFVSQQCCSTSISSHALMGSARV